MAETTGRARSKGSPRPKRPSRERYEHSHPTMSFRVSIADQERLLDILKAQHMSLKELVLAAADKRWPRVKKAVDACEDAFEEGYEDAKLEYRVVYPCAICGEPMEATSDEEKHAVAQYMHDHGWAHGPCQEKRRRGLA